MLAKSVLPECGVSAAGTRAAAGTLSTRLVSDPAATLRLDPPGLSVSLTDVLAG